MRSPDTPRRPSIPNEIRRTTKTSKSARLKKKKGPAVRMVENMLAEAARGEDGERGEIRALREELRALREENAALRTRLAEHERQRTKLLQQQGVLKSVIAAIPYCVFWKDR